MSDILKLKIIDFCTLENNEANALSSKEHYFEGTARVTAYKMCCDFLQTLNIKPYLAWNLEVYPKFILEKIYMWKKDEDKNV